MEHSRDEFLHACNVAHYTRLLRDAPDAARRKVLISLLEEERAKARIKGWAAALR
jgi:hypothetical protein